MDQVGVEFPVYLPNCRYWHFTPHECISTKEMLREIYPFPPFFCFVLLLFNIDVAKAAAIQIPLFDLAVMHASKEAWKNYVVH